MLMSGTVVGKDEEKSNTLQSGSYLLSCASFPRSDLVVQGLDEDDRMSPKYQKYIDGIYDSWRK